MHLPLQLMLLAQLVLDGPTPAPVGLGQQILNSFVTPSGFGGALFTVLGIIGALMSKQAIWKRRIALATYHAYHIVEDVAADNAEAGKAVDKPALFLQQLDTYFQANGWRPLKQGERTLAVMQAQSMSGQTVVQAAANAVAAAVGVPPPPAPPALGTVLIPPPPAP